MSALQSVSVCVFSEIGVKLFMILLSKKISIKYVFCCDTDLESNLMLVRDLCEAHSINFIKLMNNDELSSNVVIPESKQIECLLLLWWPHILKTDSIDLFDFVINLHPSLLPFGRGKYGYFWSIVNDEPFGASLHLVDEGIDTGKILVQKEISVDPTDTGEDLYEKGVKACISLFDENIYSLLENLEQRIKLSKNCTLKQGSYNTKADFIKYCNEIEDQSFNIKDAIKYLLARTFQKGTSYRYKMNNKTYECKLTIKEIN